jgi:allantoinase
VKRAAADKKCWVNVGFWGGVVPGNAGELSALARAGVFGFKCFLVPSGVPEFEQVREEELRIALPKLAALDVPLLVHAELPGPIEEAATKLGQADPTNYNSWLWSRPASAETKAIELMIHLADEFRARVHIVHLSSVLSVPLIHLAQRRGVRITSETCPHYLYFSAHNFPIGATQYKCAPPIRDWQNKRGLLTALGKGKIDFVVSDHSPSPPAMKCLDTGDFFKAWGGISSLQLGLPIMWTKSRRRNYTLGHLAQWMSAGPARLVGLEKRKGTVAAGYDADFVVWNPNKKFIVRPEMLLHRHKVTPYAHEALFGEVEATFLRGEMIHDRGRFADAPIGELLRRGEC